MDLLRGLGNLFRKVRPPTVYLVARLAPDGSAAVAAFRDPDGAARCLVHQYRRRAGRPSNSSAPPGADEIVQAYQALNNNPNDERPEFWTVVPVKLVSPTEKEFQFRFQAELFDLTGIEDDPTWIGTCDLPGISVTGGEVERSDHTRPADRSAPAPETIEQIYLATEWLEECDITCFAFEDAATAKRFTLQKYNKYAFADEETDDFRTAFRELNRSDGDGDADDGDGDDDEEDDESAFSLCTVRLGRDRFIPILNGPEPARKADTGRGFCDLPDSRIGQALPLDD